MDKTFYNQLYTANNYCFCMLQLEPSIHVDQKANKTKNQKTKIKDSNKKPTDMIKFIAVAKPKSSIKELNN